jgi:coenzyme PQQ precursor peptide PqqA
LIGVSASHKYKVHPVFSPIHQGDKMAWKTPKIVEVSVGMEINMYACARK